MDKYSVVLHLQRETPNQKSDRLLHTILDATSAAEALGLTIAKDEYKKLIIDGFKLYLHSTLKIENTDG